MRACEHDSRPLAAKLIEPIREAARACGYAVGVHGTLIRDIDLIAVPWVEGAAEPRELLEAVLKVCRAINVKADLAYREEYKSWWMAGTPGAKPHGRIGWLIHLGGGPYIDLSVMPLARSGSPSS